MEGEQGEGGGGGRKQDGAGSAEEAPRLVSPCELRTRPCRTGEWCV